MVEFPQRGGCLCGDLGYCLDEDPLTLYACHCTDCQTQSGSSFGLSMIVRKEGLRLVRGQAQEYAIELPDGRIKRACFCARCSTRLWGPSSIPGLLVLEPGTLDDTSWLHAIGHIWARSAQPWVVLPDGPLVFRKQPEGDESLALVRAWKQRSTA